MEGVTRQGIRLARALALLLVVALFVSIKISFSPRFPGDQGCINQGADRRLLAIPICWAQRHLSWKSENEPSFLSIGATHRLNLGLAWPPYLVINWYRGRDQWGMFRIGFRYDRNWHGYIFPTIAWKVISSPLRY
jgi:hypothetical protein